MVSVNYKKALDWTKAIREEEEKRENELILDKYLLGYTLDEIAEPTGMVKMSIGRRIEKVCNISFLGTKRYKLSEFSLDHNDKGEEVADETGERGESSLSLRLVGGKDG